MTSRWEELCSRRFVYHFMTLKVALERFSNERVSLCPMLCFETNFYINKALCFFFSKTSNSLSRSSLSPTSSSNLFALFSSSIWVSSPQQSQVKYLTQLLMQLQTLMERHGNLKLFMLPLNKHTSTKKRSTPKNKLNSRLTNKLSINNKCNTLVKKQVIGPETTNKN